MAIVTKANFSGAFLTSTGIFADNNVGDITPSDLRAGFQNYFDSQTKFWPLDYSDREGYVLSYNVSSGEWIKTDRLNTSGGFKFGDVSGGNYTEFQEDTGFSMSYGSGIGWEDLRFPAASINPPGGIGGAAPSTVNNIYIGTLLFDAASTEIVTGQAQLPHSWKEGTIISPHIHWAPTTADAGNVLWQLDYTVSNIDGNYNPTYTTIQATGVCGLSASGHQLLEFEPDIDMTGKTVSSMVLWRISRIGGDAADTYGADARLYEFDIHYQVDTIGSRQEYIK